MKIVRAKRWETFKEQQRVMKEENERLQKLRGLISQWLQYIKGRLVIIKAFEIFDKCRQDKKLGEL
jgi:hypothetical protein